MPDTPLSQRVTDLELDVVELRHKQRSDAGSTSAAVDQVHAELVAFRREVSARFDAVDARFDRVEAALAEILTRLPAAPTG